MNKFWLFLNGQLVSGLIIALAAWWIGNQNDSSEMDLHNTFSKQTVVLEQKIDKLETELVSYKGRCLEKCVPDQDKLAKPEEPKWKTVLGVSWAKAGHFIDVNRYASSDRGVTKFNANVDFIDNGTAEIRISTSANGNVHTKALKVGEDMEFTNDSRKFRLTLVSIRKAGFWNTMAAYFKVEIEDRKI